MDKRKFRFFALIFLALSIVKNSSAQSLNPGATFRDCPDCPEMVVVPSGSFMMGSSPADSTRDIQSANKSVQSRSIPGVVGGDVEMARKSVTYEHPQHTVKIPYNFGLSVYPVTVAEFARFVENTGYSTASCIPMGRSRRSLTSGLSWKAPGFNQSQLDPVVCVSWNDAQAYIAWLNKKTSKKPVNDTGRSYRLPSEAEWEYAARARTETARWWGNDIGLHTARCQGCDPEYGIGTIPANSFGPNPFGLYNMLGNVWQWTDDCWHDTYDGAPHDGSTWKCQYSGRYVIRGGGWNNFPWSVRSTTRAGLYAGLASNARGFRVAESFL